jgi:hypothetical protein
MGALRRRAGEERNFVHLAPLGRAPRQNDIEARVIPIPATSYFDLRFGTPNLASLFLCLCALGPDSLTLLALPTQNGSGGRGWIS